MTSVPDFSEISILIPGYSIEDLPTDLPEENASSLLNAVACAWHPRLLQRSTSIPLFRQAESLSGYPGRRIVLVPAPSESWMPHEWRSVLRDQGHVVIAGCISRAEWLDAIDAALAEETGAATCADAAPETLSGANATSVPPANPSASILEPSSELRDHFLALGTILLQTLLLSRRRHHFVDADNQLLGREVKLAADAWASGDDATARLHLRLCFEHLRETRERFYPMNCYLIDICIPGDDEDPAAIQRLLESSRPLNLFATGHDFSAWITQQPSLGSTIQESVASGQLCLLTGHDSETRSSLGSMAATVDDLRRCREIVTSLTDSPPRHWARRRYGMTASLPALLHHFGFESALHVALDDGLYPDRERSQFDWQAPDGSIVAAASRIPLAIDSASGFLRFADRYNESMQDDTTAALFVARLPTLRSPWLTDLHIAADYAPVLGEFATMDKLCHVAGGSRLAERYEHSEYLAPFLIQSSVLKTEPPISGPAALRQRVQQLESLRTALGIAALIRAAENSRDWSASLARIESDIAALELQHVDVQNTDPDRATGLQQAAGLISEALRTVESSIALAIRSKVPSQAGTSRGCFLINSLPFARFTSLVWPETWRRPASSASIELSQRVKNVERLLVKLPPGGFVWLTEHEASQQPQPLMEPAKGEASLAEPLTLRNRHFEVTLSDRTGGISAVAWHHQRGNRLSQQACFRYERDLTLPDDGSGEVRKVSYAGTRLISQRVVEQGTVFASVETIAELISPADESRLATVRQTTSIDRVQPRITVTLQFEDISVSVKGNPWLTYYGCRFAWDNESASITRAILGQACGFRSERFESPDYVEISDQDHRVVIATHGRPYHRRSGPRMLDSLLIVEGETSRTFQFTIEFDQPFPLRTAADVLTPPLVHETSDVVPTTMPGSWILGVSAKNVELVRIDHSPATSEQSEELLAMLSETDGVSVQCLVKTARKPSAAFSVNADQTEKTTLNVTEQGVAVTLNAFQIKHLRLVF